jgi:hypothetical protein
MSKVQSFLRQPRVREALGRVNSLAEQLRLREAVSKVPPLVREWRLRRGWAASTTAPSSLVSRPH